MPTVKRRNSSIQRAGLRTSGPVNIPISDQGLSQAGSQLAAAKGAGIQNVLSFAQQGLQVYAQFDRERKAEDDRVKRQSDQAFVIDTMNKAEDFYRTSWSKDYKVNNQGQNAKNALDDRTKFVDKMFNSTIETLENDDQKAIYKRAYASFRKRKLDQAQNYSEGQLAQFNSEVLTAANRVSINIMSDEKYVTNENGTKSINFKSANLGIQEITDRTQQKYAGRDPAFINAKVQQATSKAHEIIIREMVTDERVKKADEYFKKYEPQIEGIIKDDLQKLIANEDINQQAHTNYLSIMGIHGNDEAKALETAKTNIDDADVLKETKNLIKTKFQENRRILKANNEKTYYDNVVGAILDEKDHATRIAMAKTLTQRNGLGNDFRLRALNLAKSQNASDESKAKLGKNPLLSNKLRIAIDTGEVTSAGQIIDLSAGKMGTASQEQVINYLNKGGKNQFVNFTGVRTLYNDIFRVVSGDDVDPNLMDFAYNYVLDNVAPNTQPTDSDMRESLLRARLLFENQGEVADDATLSAGIGSDKTYAEAIEDGEEAIWVPDVSKEERLDIESKIRESNARRVAKGLPKREITAVAIGKYKKHHPDYLGIPFEREAK